jgi:hypothetical protein
MFGPVKEDIATVLSQHFSTVKTFTNNELEEVLKTFYQRPYQSATYRWRIHDLKERGIIQNMGRGVYAFPQSNKNFQPRITEEASRIYQTLRKSLPYTKIALTDTAWLNEFMVHQVFKTYIVIEVEKEAALSAFNNLHDEFKQSYLNPGRDVFQYYIVHKDQPVIINSMISESPLAETNDIIIAALEKILVDLVSNELLYAAQQEERTTIFVNAFSKYFVNMSKLRRYARRRNRMEQIEELIKITETNDR